MASHSEGILFNYLKFTIIKSLPLNMKNTYDAIFSVKNRIKVYHYVCAKHVENKATLEENTFEIMLFLWLQCYFGLKIMKWEKYIAYLMSP